MLKGTAIKSLHQITFHPHSAITLAILAISAQTAQFWEEQILPLSVISGWVKRGVERQETNSSLTQEEGGLQKIEDVEEIVIKYSWNQFSLGSTRDCYMLQCSGSDAVLPVTEKEMWKHQNLTEKTPRYDLDFLIQVLVVRKTMRPIQVAQGIKWRRQNQLLQILRYLEHQNFVSDFISSGVIF